MPILVVILTLFLLPANVYCHPGKTNYQGGHRCLKGCAEWDLYYGEYHLHDKEGRPVRVAKKARSAKKKAMPEEEPPQQAAVEEPAAPIIPQPRPVPVRAAVTTSEPEVSYLPWLLILLLLLLLLLLLKRRRE